MVCSANFLFTSSLIFVDKMRTVFTYHRKDQQVCLFGIVKGRNLLCMIHDWSVFV